MTSRGFSYISVIVIVAALAIGCSASNRLKGGLFGAGAGGTVGAVIGNQYGSSAKGAIIGAAVGGTAGAIIGNYMDRQAEEMQQSVEGAKVERVGEGIQLTFDSGILFATNSSTLSATAQLNVADLAAILQKYPDTNIVIAGHTDSTGADDYNQKLSERRAEAVTNYLLGKGISKTRLTTVGLGETQPVATNDTLEGRTLNRRVEVAVVANEDLKTAAKDGKKL